MPMAWLPWPGKMKAMLIRGTARALVGKSGQRHCFNLFCQAGPNLAPQLRLTDVSRAEKSRLRQIVRARRVSAKRPARKRSCIREIRHESREACRRPCRYRNPDRDPAAPRRATDVALEGQDAIRSRACAALERRKRDRSHQQVR